MPVFLPIRKRRLTPVHKDVVDPIDRNLARGARLLFLAFIMIMIGIMWTLLGSKSSKKSTKNYKFISGIVLTTTGVLMVVIGSTMYAVFYRRKTVRDKEKPKEPESEDPLNTSSSEEGHSDKTSMKQSRKVTL